MIDFKVTAQPPQAKPGTVVQLTITATLKPGYHTYPLLQPRPGQTPISTLSFESNRDLTPLWPTRESPPEFVINAINDIDLEHDKGLTWSQGILVQPNASPGVHAFDVLINLQVCDEKACYGPAPYPPIEAKIDVLPGPAVELTPRHKKAARSHPTACHSRHATR